MKVYRIKTNDFAKLTSNKNLLTIEQQEKLEHYQNLIVDKVNKFLPHGKDIVLCITDNDYIITSRPCYVDSINNILLSVGITQDKIKVLRKSTDKNLELTVDQLKNILL